MSTPSGASQSASIEASPSCGVGKGENPARWLAEEIQPHENFVRNYLRRQFPFVESDDVIQESYLKVLKGRAAGSVIQGKAYFFAVARNTAKRLFRRRKLFSDSPVVELPASCLLDDSPDASQTVNSKQKYALAIEAIDQLPERCGEVVRLAMVEGLSQSEIAGRLGLAENTVRVQLVRGVKKCAEYLRQRGEGL